MLKGKLYAAEAERLVVLCTANSPKGRFPGVIIYAVEDSDFNKGDYSETWVAGSFHEYEANVLLSNVGWEPDTEVATTPG